MLKKAAWRAGHIERVTIRWHVLAAALFVALNLYAADTSVSMSSGEKIRLIPTGIEPGMNRSPLLGMEIEVPGIAGRFLLQYPEAIHSSRGLLYVDCDSANPPPIAMPSSFPKWTPGSTPDEWTYHFVLPVGFEWWATLRAGTDEIAMNFRIRNSTAEACEISPIVCLMLNSSPSFSDAQGLENVFTWVDGRFTSLEPSAEILSGGKQASSLLLFLKTSQKSLPAHERLLQGESFTYPRYGDVPLIARTDKDKRWLVAISGTPRSPFLFSNAQLACIHVDPESSPKIAPGASYEWPGRIYVVKNEPAALRARFDKEQGLLKNTPTAP